MIFSRKKTKYILEHYVMPCGCQAAELWKFEGNKAGRQIDSNLTDRAPDCKMRHSFERWTE